MLPQKSWPTLISLEKNIFDTFFFSAVNSNILVNDIEKLEEVVDAEAGEVVGEDKDLGLGLDVLPNPRLARLQLFLDVLSL